jgi:hypothetical protein
VRSAPDGSRCPLAGRERSALFAETAARMKTTPAVAEKDFWVTWVLDRLFADAELARLLMFKGGTSLSKAYRLIERFSEDIDLILDWRMLSGEDPLAERSKAKQEKLNAEINEQAQAFIGGRIADAHRGRARRALCQCRRARGRSACDRDSLSGSIPRHLSAAGIAAGDRAAHAEPRLALFRDELAIATWATGPTAPATATSRRAC